MGHFRSIFVTLLVITVIAAPTIIAGTQSTHYYDNTPVAQDAKMYAAEYGIDIASAIYRLELQDLAGDLDAKLYEKEAGTFAGLWIQHTPEFRIIVQFTHDGEKTIQPYIENEPLEDYVDIRTAKVSLAELEVAQTTALLKVRNQGIPIESGINVFENRVELFVIERSRLETLIQETKIQISENVEIVTVDTLSANTVDIYGGLALSSCTSGFSVKHINGVTGIITAAHCPNDLSYNGTNLTFKGSAEGGSYDVQWHAVPGFTVRNLLFDGLSNRYIYSTKHRDNLVVNEWVCKYGKTTGYGCGNIIDKNYLPTTPDHTWSARFIRVHHEGIDLSEPGDSGGPWFLGNTAYGIMRSQIGDDAIFMAINYIDILDLTVLTNRIYLPLIIQGSPSETLNGSGTTFPYPPPINEAAPSELPVMKQPYPYP